MFTNIPTLEPLNLSGKERELYSTCLALGPSKAKDIVTNTSLNRGTLYDIARSLFRKGLLSSTQKRGVTYFVAHPPHHLLASLERQVEEIRSISPDIEAFLRSTTLRPTFRLFEGREGAQAIITETLECSSKEILQFTSIQTLVEFVGVGFLKDYVRRRVRRHIRIRALKDPRGEVDSTLLEGHSTESDHSRLMETRISEISVEFPAILMIFDNSVAFISSQQEGFGFILDSPIYSSMLRQFFESAWRTSRPIEGSGSIVYTTDEDRI